MEFVKSRSLMFNMKMNYQKQIEGYEHNLEKRGLKLSSKWKIEKSSWAVGEKVVTYTYLNGLNKKPIPPKSSKLYTQSKSNSKAAISWKPELSVIIPTAPISCESKVVNNFLISTHSSSHKPLQSSPEKSSYFLKMFSRSKPQQVRVARLGHSNSISIFQGQHLPKKVSLSKTSSFLISRETSSSVKRKSKERVRLRRPQSKEFFEIDTY